MATTEDRILNGGISRRRLLSTLPAAGLALGAISAFAQSKPELYRFVKTHHLSVSVSDLKRSAEFYQKLFGFPPIRSLAPAGSNTFGFYFNKFLLSLQLTTKDKAGKITHVGIGVANLDKNREAAALRAAGFENVRADADPDNVWVFVPDPDKTPLQIIDETWAQACPKCDAPPGGAAVSTPKDPIFRPRKMHHVGINVSDLKRSADFYRRLLGFPPIKALPPPGSQTYGFDMNDNFLILNVNPQHAGVITHFAVGVDGFNAARDSAKMRAAGFTDVLVDNIGTDNWLSVRDPDGAVVRVLDANYRFPCPTCAAPPV